MNRTIDRLKFIFLGIFLAANIGILIWQVGWAWPAQKCGEAHKWWDYSQRVCATPVMLSDITGRTFADKQLEAANRAALGRPAAPAKP